MTIEEFQRETNYYMTDSEQEARAKAAEYNERGVDGETIVAAKYGVWWCLMLSDAYALTKELGIADN